MLRKKLSFLSVKRCSRSDVRSPREVNSRNAISHTVFHVSLTKRFYGGKICNSCTVKVSFAHAAFHFRMIYGTGSTLDTVVTRLCYVELSTCSRDVISRGETWVARMHVWALAIGVHRMARGWRARMCARLINIAISPRRRRRANDKLEKASSPEYCCVPSGRHVIVIKVA